MKKRRTLILAMLLVATMVMGIGYASYTRVLKINGDATFNQDNDMFVVNFTDANIVEYNAGGSEISVGADGQTPTANISGGTIVDFNAFNLKGEGDYAVVTVKIKNESKVEDIDAVLKSVVPSDYTLTVDGVSVDNPDILDITYKIVKDDAPDTVVWDNVAGNDALTLGYNETATMTITLKLNHSLAGKSVIADANFELNFDGEVNHNS